MHLPKPTGRQKEVLYLPPVGHVVVLGTAGSGKTVMAVHRARYLANPQTSGSGPVLLLTFSHSLINYLRSALSGVTDGRVDALTYHGFAKATLKASGVAVDPSTYLSDPNKMKTLTARATLRVRRQTKGRVFDRPQAFFEEELDWLAAHGIESLEDYLTLTRVGRSSTRLTDEERRDVWRVRDSYLALRRGKGYEFDLRDIASTTLNNPAINLQSLGYRHIIIDEGQDLTPEMVRSLAGATPTEGSITFFGDYGQQIYGQRLSWRSAGLAVKKAWRFEHNYRNTREIARLALELSRHPSFDASDELIATDLPDRSGPIPQVVMAASAADEIAVVAALAERHARKGLQVAVLSRTRGPAARVRKLLGQHGLELSRDSEHFPSGKALCGTIYASKGLEFDSVFLIGTSEGAWPDTASTDDHNAPHSGLDLKLLYVGVTRSRLHLTVTHSGNMTSLLPDSIGLLEHVA